MDVQRMYIQTRVYNKNKEDMVFMIRLYSYGDKYEWKSLVNIYFSFAYLSVLTGNICG